MLHRRQYFLLHKLVFFLLVVLFPAAPMLEGRVGQTEGRAVSEQTYTYKVVGDCQIQADVYRFPDTVVRPVIFVIHGGALILGDRRAPNRDEIERYVREGYIVVSIDY